MTRELPTYALAEAAIRNASGASAYGRYTFVVSTPHGRRRDFPRAIAGNGPAPDAPNPGAAIDSYENSSYIAIEPGQELTIERQLLAYAPRTLSGVRLILESSPLGAFEIIDGPTLSLPQFRLTILPDDDGTDLILDAVDWNRIATGA